jgi:hypothetical protein
MSALISGVSGFGGACGVCCATANAAQATQTTRPAKLNRAVFMARLLPCNGWKSGPTPPYRVSRNDHRAALTSVLVHGSAEDIIERLDFALNASTIS